jgi:hypothetical protein
MTDIDQMLPFSIYVIECLARMTGIRMRICAALE